MSRRNQENQKLVDLFQNRVELKKEFATLRQERVDLSERLEEQERLGKRAEEELRQLEVLLAEPDSGFNVMVFFHLRGLWRTCREQLESFGDVLRKQQMDRQRKKQIMQFNQDREKRLAVVNGEVVQVKSDTDELKQVIENLEIRLDNLGGFWNYFKRKSLKLRIEQENTHLANRRADIEELFNKRIKIESEQWPEEAGIGFKGKRAVNLALIAYAQHLYIHFSDHDLSVLAKTATVRRPGDIQYGNRADCEFLMEKIRDAVEQVKQDRDYSQEIKNRIEDLRSVVEYADDESTVPIASSIPGIGLIVGNVGFTRTVSDRPSEINILADNYWDIESAMIG